VLPSQAYAEQYALARRIEAERTRIAAANHAVSKLLESLAATRGRAPQLASAIDAAAARLHAIAGTRAAPNWHNAWSFPPNSVQTLRYVGELLDKLEHAVDESDNAPSPDARAGFAKAVPLADATLANWTAWQSRELPALNERLTKAGQPALSITD
jgi:hypothetical protein